MGLAGKSFCLLVIVVGFSIISLNVSTVYGGLQIWRSGETVPATVINKVVERPHSSKPVRMESVTINGQKVRSLRTYLYDYLLTVRYEANGVVREAIAPVGYARWHDRRVGDRLEISTVEAVADFVDIRATDTLIHGLRQMALGLLIIAVGFLAMRLPEEDS